MVVVVVVGVGVGVVVGVGGVVVRVVAVVAIAQCVATVTARGLGCFDLGSMRCSSCSDCFERRFLGCPCRH